MQTTTPLDTRARMLAIHAASVRLVRNHDSRMRGDATRKLARDSWRVARARMTVAPEIAQACENLATRKREIRDGLKSGAIRLHDTPHASAQGWHALYVARLVRENPARTSYTTAELLATLRGQTRELA